MLPEVGATELLVIAAIALIVVGPKDLPVMMRKLGQFLSRMRSMAQEFRASFDEMARQSELDELRREVESMRAGRFLDPMREAAADARDVEAEQVFRDIHQDLTGVEATPEPAALPKPTKRVAAKKTVAGKPAATKPGAKKPPAKTAVAKPAARKPPAKASVPKAAAKKPAARKKPRGKA